MPPLLRLSPPARFAAAVLLLLTGWLAVNYSTPAAAQTVPAATARATPARPATTQPSAVAVAQARPATADPGDQVIRFIRSNPADHLAAAPPPPVRPANLKLRLVDYLDCTSTTDRHPFLHDGQSDLAPTDQARPAPDPLHPASGPPRPATGQLSYRRTGPMAGSWFAYRLRVGAANRAHVVVLEFPDDADRLTALSLSQPPTGRAATPAARMEFGYRSGDLEPLSGRMLCRWTFFYPTSAEPAALLVANFHARSPAALARAWVYLVEDARLPPVTFTALVGDVAAKELAAKPEPPERKPEKAFAIEGQMDPTEEPADEAEVEDDAADEVEDEASDEAEEEVADGMKTQPAARKPGRPAKPAPPLTHRHAGRYDGSTRTVFTRFGGRAENLLQVMDYLGLDQASFDAMHGRQLSYPSKLFATGDLDQPAGAADQGGDRSLPEILQALTADGKKLIAVFDPDCEAGTFLMPGRFENLADLAEPRIRSAWIGFLQRDFLTSLPKGRGLDGLMLGGPLGGATAGWRSGNNFTTLLTELANRLGPERRLYVAPRAARPGGHYLENGGDWSTLWRWAAGPAAGGEVSPDGSLDRDLADQAIDQWRACGLEEQQLFNLNQQLALGLQSPLMMRQCDRDQAAANRFGRQALPRYWLLKMIAESPTLTEHLAQANTTGLLVTGTPMTRLLHLQPGQFWWAYEELSATMPPAGPGYLAPAALALAAGLEPYTAWFAGHGAAEALHEDEVRRWTTVFRQIPYRSFKPLPEAAGPNWPVVARSYDDGQWLWVYLVNADGQEGAVTLKLSAAQTIEFIGEDPDAATAAPAGPGGATTAESAPGDGSTPRPVAGDTRTEWSLKIAPYGLRLLRFPSGAVLEKAAPDLANYRAALAARADRYEADCRLARQLNVPLEKRFFAAAKEAREFIEKGDLRAAARLLQPGLTREPALRMRVQLPSLDHRPQETVPQSPAPITIDGQLDDWAGARPIQIAAAGNLVCDERAANHWRGPADLSAELFLAWGPAGLYYAVRVTDDQPTDDENEAGRLCLSLSGYRDFGDRRPYDLVINLGRQRELRGPQLVTLRQGLATVHEGLIPVAQFTSPGAGREAGAAVAPGAPPATLGLSPGRAFGLNLVISDSDDRRGMPHSWDKTNLLMWSNHQDGYSWQSDAQTCGEIALR